jgi:hypothetical protein
LVAAYEGMRPGRGAERTSRAGYDLLRRQGLAAWIEAFSGCVGGGGGGGGSSSAVSPAPPAAAFQPGRRGPGEGLTVPCHLYPELTGLLAGLALGQLGEAVC